jgi:glycolate oxidase FAD binding subunit
MTTVQPTTIAELSAVIPSQPRWSTRAGGTKPALSAIRDDVPLLDLTALSGIVEYTPEECTFTALCGTRIVELERALAAHGQYLPFDPPFASSGATIGGTVGAGVNGSCRYRFGGIRDFVIGARIVDGEGHVVHSGGKVVKNAAGFLLHQAMVGSCGRLGIVAEVTFKVFPAPESHATVRVDAGDLDAALAMLAAVQRARVDLEAIDLTPPGEIFLRLGGFSEALEARATALREAVGGPADILLGEDDAVVWHEARELGWAQGEAALVRVPISLPRLGQFDDLLSGYNSIRRYTVAGNLAWISWPADLDVLGEILRGQDLVGQVIRGAPTSPFIGAVAPNPFEDRLRGVMDPHGRFSNGAFGERAVSPSGS